MSIAPEELAAAMRDLDSPWTLAWLAGLGMAEPVVAGRRLAALVSGPDTRGAMLELLPSLLTSLQEAPLPDVALMHFERVVESAAAQSELVGSLLASPRKVEFLTRLFLGNPHLTALLLRDPTQLDRLTENRQLAEVKPPPKFTDEALRAIDGESLEFVEPRLDQRSVLEPFDRLRRYQQTELLRIAACDTFHLMDLRTVTRQLSGLADGVVEASLLRLAADHDVDVADFFVLAFGKLGGDELNYSSDVDLVFVARSKAERFWGIGQRLTRVLTETTSEGFLYRVDLRLRPWGRSGPLVTSTADYVDYLRQHGRQWERQALLKARPIAGAIAAGQDFLHSMQSLILSTPAEEVRSGVLAMKRKIESRLGDTAERDVKNGPGGIRDIEFLTQYLQLSLGPQRPDVLCRGTLDALVRLADAELILPGEFRHLSSSYVFQRTVEHALQLADNRQEHSIPRQPRELDHLARRLDFAGADQFLSYLREHRRYVREIFTHHLVDTARSTQSSPAPDVREHFGEISVSHARLFDEAERARHAELLRQIADDQLLAIAVEPRGEQAWRLTVAGVDIRGDLALMCGLLFVTGLDIEAGHVFTGEAVAVHSKHRRGAGKLAAHKRRKFVNRFDVRPLPHLQGTPDWPAFEAELQQLLVLAAADQLGEAQGRLARRVAEVLQGLPNATARLLPVEIDVDNNAAAQATTLRIRAEDTPGFLYELCNSLTVSGLSIDEVRIESQGRRAIDTLLVTDAKGGQITDPRRIQELRAAIVLTKHFTHLLPSSPNPESALQHFRELLRQLFQQPDWLGELASLQQPEVLAALVQVLGVSDFLWEDFLRLQHSSLFPLLTDFSAAGSARSRPTHRGAGAATLAAVISGRPSRHPQSLQGPRNVPYRHAARPRD
ncbi:MAG: hypothetical protein R3B90_03495 [Planctomycetaceae bacterium]